MLYPLIERYSIYITLTSRGDGTFHWALGIGIDTTTVDRFHATNRTGAWVYERVNHLIVGSESCSVVLKIGTLGVATADHVDEILSDISMKVPVGEEEPAFTCRVWLKQAVRALNMAGIIRCSSVSALEAECRRIGHDQSQETDLGRGYFLGNSQTSY